MQNEKVVSDGRVPSIGQVLKCYRTIAAAERVKTGRPAEYRLCTGAGPALASAIHPLTFP